MFSSHPFWTSSSLDVPAGVTQEEGHTGFLIHLPSAVRALIFVARRIQPFLSFVDREVELQIVETKKTQTEWYNFCNSTSNRFGIIYLQTRTDKHPPTLFPHCGTLTLVQFTPSTLTRITYVVWRSADTRKSVRRSDQERVRKSGQQSDGAGCRRPFHFCSSFFAAQSFIQVSCTFWKISTSGSYLSSYIQQLWPPCSRFNP